ncbi:hypothetical protein [Phyllobacterium sp. A18/5-2]|uniref:hypothetical protein n=1 Tax=Phyllobacterium sp. A18/5-2 TaxID=2978392 RepID=UPI0021CA91B5|nr:hypothetical protein [Phyllobacterium sp. A18/5-2]
MGITTAAESLFGDEIRLVKQRIVAVDARTNDRLQRSVRAAAIGKQISKSGSDFVVVERRSLLPVVMKIISIPDLLADAFGRTRVWFNSLIPRRKSSPSTKSYDPRLA